jgi:hypothetical protein
MAFLEGRRRRTSQSIHPRFAPADLLRCRPAEDEGLAVLDLLPACSGDLGAVGGLAYRGCVETGVCTTIAMEGSWRLLPSLPRIGLRKVLPLLFGLHSQETRRFLKRKVRWSSGRQGRLSPCFLSRPCWHSSIVRRRCSAANPGMPSGGFIGESIEILGHLDRMPGVVATYRNPRLAGACCANSGGIPRSARFVFLSSLS